MKKYLLALSGVLLLGAGCAGTPVANDVVGVADFRACVEGGYPVAGSYPRTCRAGNETFTEDIGNTQEKADVIRVVSPVPNTLVASPLSIVGEARGTWFFEASFPVRVVDANGVTLGTGIAQAAGEWMTMDFVPFTVIINFTASTTPTGTLVLEKDNPSGLPANDDSLTFPIWF